MVNFIFEERIKKTQQQKIFITNIVNKYCELDQRTNQWFQKIKTIQKKPLEVEFGWIYWTS